MRNLRERREAAGLSRFKLAVAAEVSPETIAAIEKHGTSTSVDKAARIARVLGTTIEDLMGEEKVAS